jgi:hypothetical protein
MGKRKDVLIQIIAHLNDLSTVELNSVPEKATTIADIARDVMKYGAFTYKDDIAWYIPPASIVKLQFVKGPDPDCEEKGCPGCDECEDDDDED